MTDKPPAGGYTRPAGDRNDWAAVCRWEDAGRPKLEADGSWFVLVDRPALDEAELDAIGLAEEQQRVGLCCTVRPGTLGYQRCWRISGHQPPHISQDQQAWISSHDKTDAPVMVTDLGKRLIVGRDRIVRTAARREVGSVFQVHSDTWETSCSVDGCGWARDNRYQRDGVSELHMHHLTMHRQLVDVPDNDPDERTKAEPVNPREMSGAELDEYLDRLTREGLDDTQEFHQAYSVWEKNQRTAPTARARAENPARWTSQSAARATTTTAPPSVPSSGSTRRPADPWPDACGAPSP